MHSGRFVRLHTAEDRVRGGGDLPGRLILGQQNVIPFVESAARRAFVKRLLRDVRALERMIAEGKVGTAGTRRIGAEQELFLVDRTGHAAPVANDLLRACDDPRFTTELGRFNIEINIDPRTFGGHCLRDLEDALTEAIAKARRCAAAIGAEIALAGILPTLRISDASQEMMAPLPRYRALDRALTRLRGEPYRLRITGTDELLIRHDSVMLEAFNASFQVHFEVLPDEFAQMYNIAQVLAAPVLAAAVNSPLLFGRRLWHETRIALFQQSIDTRSRSLSMRDSIARVWFGSRWVDESVLEIFKEDIARFPLLVASDLDEDPFDALAADRIPRLSALMLHNGTIYRWTRACYGVHDGEAHLRIENRVLPAGPTPLDEVANAAFWFGLMSGVSRAFPDVTRHIVFDETRTNFFAVAARGLRSQITWLDGRTWPARQLILEELLPLAREGLLQSHTATDDIDRYLGVLEERVRLNRTGAQWLLDSYSKLNGAAKPGRLRALTLAMIERQHSGKPVHEWPLAGEESGGTQESFMRAEQYMSTDLFTVREDELVDLVASLMEWRKIGHIPVEDDHQRLVGLVDYRSLLPLITREEWRHAPNLAVAEVMRRDPPTVAPQASTLEVIRAMQRSASACVLVVDDDHLVGIITLNDLLPIAARLFAGVTGADGGSGEG